MARDEAAPFARGETFNNGGPIDLVNLGGTNLEGKEFVLEVNTPDAYSQADPSGRLVRVKVVRNVSGVALKPGRIARYSAASTAPYETQTDGYAVSVADRPAGVVDEFLPAAGVLPNDLFYLVIKGPVTIVQGATTAANVAIGNRLVVAAYGSTAGDDLGGRLALQDLTGATAPLANNIQGSFGFAAAANNVVGATVPATVNFH